MCPARRQAISHNWKRLKGEVPFPGLGWFCLPAGNGWGTGVTFPLSKQSGAGRFLWFDVLLQGPWFVTFFVKLEGGNQTHRAVFSPLNECQTRQVFAVPPGRWTRVTIGVERKTEPATRVFLSRLTLADVEPPIVGNPFLPAGPLVDAMGQSRFHPWPGRYDTVPDMTRAMHRQWKAAPRQAWPASYSRWGGWKTRRVKVSGFFRTHYDGRRWWLVDPDGHLFWSSGVDCVHGSIDNESKVETKYLRLDRAHAELPNVMGPAGRCFRTNPWHSKQDREFNYLEANFVRAFGPEQAYDRWITLAHGELRRLGFNTAGDWSDEYAARREGTPYVRPFERHFLFEHAPMVGPAMPDVFEPGLREDARHLAESLRETLGDPAMIGYFLHNEPPWDWHPAGVAAIMLQTVPACRARREFVTRLRRKYGSESAFRKAWGGSVRFRDVAEGLWTQPFSECATRDVQDFSTLMLARLLKEVGTACRRVDPDHLNLGVRWWTFPPVWALKAMGSCDVVSFNYYQPRVDMVGYGREREPGVEQVVAGLRRPFMVGEWHFGALDGGLGSAGLLRVRDQAERGKAFRHYLEQAAALPWCVGAHWFNLYDRNALYSPGSNENYNIGFYTGTHAPHEPICRAARKSHERLYAVASGRIPHFKESAELVFPSR